MAISKKQTVKKKEPVKVYDAYNKKRIPLKDATLIGDKYYLRSECILVGRTTYHKSDKSIVTDYITGFYVHISACRIVYSAGKKKNYTVAMVHDTVYIQDLDIHYISVEDAIKDGYHEDYGSGMFYSKKTQTCKRVWDGKFNFPVTKHDPLGFGEKSLTFLKTEGKRYKFGVELETSIGLIPHHVRKRLNMNAVFDGSLRDEEGNVKGGEYTTGVLTGDSGFEHLYEIVKELALRCEVNRLCSIHVHISNDKNDFAKDTVVYFYKLACLLENEFFMMQPKSRQRNVYCARMNNIVKVDLKAIKKNYEVAIYEYYEKILKIIACQKELNSNINKDRDHPFGHNCGYDKSTPRYWWINFVPTMFNTRGNKTYTLEFRIHSATLNYIKVQNWVLICMAFVDFCENHKNKFTEDLTLRDVLKAVFPKNHQKLSDYVDSRKSKFNKTSSEDTDDVNVIVKNRKELLKL